MGSFRFTRRALPLAALLSATAVSVAFPSGEPEGSRLYDNVVRALEVLDRAVEAHGGSALLDRALDIRLSFTGTFRYQAHYAAPWAERAYRLDGTWLYAAEAGVIKTEATFDYDRPLPTFTILGPTAGLTLDAGASRPDSIAPEDLDAKRRGEFEFLPQEFLRQARAHAAGLRLLPGGDGTDILDYTLEDGESRALFFDSTTHLLSRVERIDHWQRKGDRLEWRTFESYASREGMPIPLHTESHTESGSTQTTLVMDITDIALGDRVKEDELAIPDAFRDGFDTWTPGEPAKADGDGLLPVHDLGRGVIVVDLPDCDARSLLVAFEDFAVIVEAGDDSDIAARLLATADHVLPDKPARYVATSHHHPLYANGIRPFVARGVTILTSAGNLDYYRDLATRPYRIRPDAQQRAKREPRFEVVDSLRVIDDGTQRIEFHEFDYSDHVDEFILTYIPSHALIMTGDLVYLLHDAAPRAAGARERAVHRLVTERGLAVDHILQTWFLTRADQLTPYAALSDMVRLAEERDAAR